MGEGAQVAGTSGDIWGNHLDRERDMRRFEWRDEYCDSGLAGIETGAVLLVVNTTEEGTELQAVHKLTPATARELGKALIAMADELEAPIK